MFELTVLQCIKQLKRPVFTTYEIASLSGKSGSNVVQQLNYLARQDIITKIYRGVWIETGNAQISPYDLIPLLMPRNKAYVSFLSALHLYGIIEQIPQVITLASLAHTKIMRTKIGIFIIHQIAPSMFFGFDWYNKKGKFLIAEPEKALIDSYYLSTRKKNQYSYFPEMNFPETFNFKKTEKWIRIIPDIRIRKKVMERFASNIITDRKIKY